MSKGRINVRVGTTGQVRPAAPGIKKGMGAVASAATAQKLVPPAPVVNATPSKVAGVAPVALAPATAVQAKPGATALTATPQSQQGAR